MKKIVQRGRTLGIPARKRFADSTGPARSAGPLRTTAPSVIQQMIRLRRRRGISQTQLARQMGVSQPAVAKLESGRATNLQLDTLRRMADALDASVTITVRPRQTGISRPRRKKLSRGRTSTSLTGNPRGS